MEKALYLFLVGSIVIISLRNALDLSRTNKAIWDRNAEASRFARHVRRKQRRGELLTKEEFTRLRGYKEAGILSCDIGFGLTGKEWLLMPRLTRFAANQALRR